uniref:Voltage-dependent calcium channel subunit alpha-2/delta-3 n=1 Tax=Macrostomum lignano TaxID=282301 RepID=A0A1I8J1K5_9PLAT
SRQKRMVSQVPSGAAAAASACGKKRALVHMMCINACSAFFILTVSVSTDFWIYTFERETSVNGTTKINAMHSGLWRKCFERKTMPAGKKTHFVWTQEAIEISGSRDNCSYHNSSHVVAAIAFIGRKSNEIKPTDI